MDRTTVVAVLIAIVFFVMILPVDSTTEIVPEEQTVEVNSVWDVHYFTVNREDVTLGRLLGRGEGFWCIFDRDWSWGGPPQVGDQTDYFGFHAEAQIHVSAESEVHFEIGSDDYSELYVDDQLVLSIRQPGSVFGGPFQETDVSLRLPPGFHKLTLGFYELEGTAHCSFSTDPDVTRWTETTTVNKTVRHPVLMFQKLRDLLVGTG